MSSTNYPPYSSNLTETIYITAAYVSGGETYSLPPSSNITETIYITSDYVSGGTIFSLPASSNITETIYITADYVSGGDVYTLPASSNLTETIYITADYVSGGSIYTLPASSNLTETVVISALPCISYVHYSKYGRKSTFRDVTITGNFLFLDNIYLSANDNSLFSPLTTEFVDFFSPANLISLRYLPTTVYNLSNAYPAFYGVKVDKFTKLSNSKVVFTLPPLINFTNGQSINFITFNKSGYCISTGITVFDVGPITPTPTPTVTPTITPTPGTPTPTKSVTPTVTPTFVTRTPTPTVTPTPGTPTPTKSVTPTVTPTFITPTPTPSVTPNVTPTLGPAIIITGSGNDFCVYGCYTLTFVGRITYSLDIHGVMYRVTDDVIQYTNVSVPTSHLTYLPSLNGWYLQGMTPQGLINYAFKPGGLGYDINTSFTVMTGGGYINSNVFPFCFTPTPTNTPTLIASSTSTPTITPTKTATPTPSITSTSTPTVTPTLTLTPSNTVTATITPTPTVTPTVTPTLTLTPSNTVTATITPTPTPTPTVTPTVTPTIAASGSFDLIRAQLTTSLASYDSAAVGDWVYVTSTEYNNVLNNVTGANYIGSSPAQVLSNGTQTTNIDPNFGEIFSYRETTGYFEPNDYVIGLAFTMYDSTLRTIRFGYVQGNIPQPPYPSYSSFASVGSDMNSTQSTIQYYVRKRPSLEPGAYTYNLPSFINPSGSLYRFKTYNSNNGWRILDTNFVDLQLVPNSQVIITKTKSWP